MKKAKVFLLICMTLELLSSPGRSKPRHVQAQNPCSLENKEQYKSDLLANSATKSDQAKALEAARKYLVCPGDPEDLAKLDLAVGQMLRKNDSHEEAISYFINAASYNSKIKTSPETYFFLAKAYEKGSYARLAAAYRVHFEGKDETDASLLAVANINQIVDCLIDSYARAVVLAGDGWRKLRVRAPGTVQESDGSFSQSECMEAVTFWYRARHNNSEAGLKELLENIQAQPLLPEPTPITSLPPRKKRKQ